VARAAAAPHEARKGTLERRAAFVGAAEAVRAVVMAALVAGLGGALLGISTMTLVPLISSG